MTTQNDGNWHLMAEGTLGPRDIHLAGGACPTCGSRTSWDSYRRKHPDGTVEFEYRCYNGHAHGFSRVTTEDRERHSDRTNFIAQDGTGSYVEPDGWSRPSDFD